MMIKHICPTVETLSLMLIQILFIEFIQFQEKHDETSSVAKYLAT